MQPIDLQILFTQLDKVGKEQANQKEGLQIQQALQGARMQRKAEERIQSVNESQDTGQGTERVKDRSPKKRQDHAGSRKGPLPGGEGDDPDGEYSPVIRDPNLGKNIDLSG
jgi:hypothetical protein